MFQFSQWLNESLIDVKRDIIEKISYAVNSKITTLLGFSDEDEMWNFARNDLRSAHLIWKVISREIPTDNKHVNNYNGNYFVCFFDAVKINVHLDFERVWFEVNAMNIEEEKAVNKEISKILRENLPKHWVISRKFGI